MPSTATVNPRVTVVQPDSSDGDWKVVDSDGTIVGVASKRGEAREEARRINAERARDEAIASQKDQGVIDPQVPEQSSSPAAEVTSDTEVDPDVQNALETNSDDPNFDEASAAAAVEAQQIEAEATSDSQDEAVAAATAEANGEPAPVAEQPKPENKGTKKGTRTPKIPTVKLRVGELKEGDMFVRNDIGIVKITGLSKMGHGQVEIAYEKADGTTGLYESWQATHARRLYHDGEPIDGAAQPAEQPVVQPAEVASEQSAEASADQPADTEPEQSPDSPTEQEEASTEE